MASTPVSRARAEQRHVEHGEELREDRDDVDAHGVQRIGAVAPEPSARLTWPMSTRSATMVQLSRSFTRAARVEPPQTVARGAATSWMLANLASMATRRTADSRGLEPSSCASIDDATIRRSVAAGRSSGCVEVGTPIRRCRRPLRNAMQAGGRSSCVSALACAWSLDACRTRVHVSRSARCASPAEARAWSFIGGTSGATRRHDRRAPPTRSSSSRLAGRISMWSSPLDSALNLGLLLRDEVARDLLERTREVDASWHELDRRPNRGSRRSRASRCGSAASDSALRSRLPVSAESTC